MHVVAFKDDVLKKYPEAAASLFKAFGEAKKICREFYADPNWSWLAWGRQAFEEEEKLLGPIPGRRVWKTTAPIWNGSSAIRWIRD